MSTRRDFVLQTAAAITVAAAASRCAVSATEPPGPMAGRQLKKYRIAHSNLTVSRLAFGCAMLGWDWSSPDFSTKTVPIIRTAYEQGITLFDLADVYGNGSSEIALGKLLQQSPGLRTKLVIQTKCGDRFAEGDSVDNSGQHIITSVEGSLQRLQTDYLDILLLHWPDSLVQPQEVADAFDRLKRAGKVRNFGVSNHSPAQYEILKQHVHQPLIANQIQLGLMHWSVPTQMPKASLTHADEGVATLDYCRAHDIWVQAYSPLKSDNINNPPNLLNPPSSAPPAVSDAVQLLADLAKKYDATPAAIMLAWLLCHPAGITPIIGATKAEHIIEACAADRIDLTRVEWYSLLDAATKIQTL